MKIVGEGKLREFVEKRLRDDQSPAAIAGRIQKQEKGLTQVSKESIYRYIRSVYGRRIEMYRAKKKTRQRRRVATKRTLDGRTFIDKRPAYISQRKRIGDSESDFIVSGKTGKGILLVVADRKGRMAFLERILHISTAAVEAALRRIKKRFPELTTITTDNDLLFQHHRELERVLQIRIYFCHPYSSWEKGTVENVNKQIRQDIPKGSDLSRYSRRYIRNLEDKLNRRPLKCLNYKTPAEILGQYRKNAKKRSRAFGKKKS